MKEGGIRGTRTIDHESNTYLGDGSTKQADAVRHLEAPLERRDERAFERGGAERQSQITCQAESAHFGAASNDLSHEDVFPSHTWRDNG